MLTDTLRSAPVTRGDFAELRRREFTRLDANGHAYLDHTGAALYPDALVRTHAAMLRDAVLGNPHSDSPASLCSSALGAEARARVLRHFDADPDEYAVCFTANASSAIHLVAESYPFSPASQLVLSADNHNSMNGVREYVRRAGGRTQYLPLDDDLRLHDPLSRLRDMRRRHSGPGLLALPAQSNFSGVRHPLELVEAAGAMGFDVLLDAAAFVPVHALSMREVPADFVAVSFYKMFGYPTGIGALIARRSALARLRRPWFAGGTVEYVSVQGDTHLVREGAEGFEDGTVNFLGLPAVTAGLEFLKAVGMDRIADHVAGLTTLLLHELSALAHRCGSPLIRLHGPGDEHSRGGTVAFNVLDEYGRTVPYSAVESAARAALVSVRGGCFCNPGASEAAFGFPAERAARCLDRARRDGFSIQRFAACMEGHPVGAVRASLGVSSNEADVHRLIDVLDGIRA